MSIELTEAQRLALEQQGEPLRLEDPTTHTQYVLVRADVYERWCSQTKEAPAPPPPDPFEIAPGIRRSKEALRRDLPELLKKRKLLGKAIAYHGDERIGIADDGAVLIRECLRRGLAGDQYYVGVIDPTELIEEEEIDRSLYEFDDVEIEDDEGKPSKWEGA